MVDHQGQPGAADGDQFAVAIVDDIEVELGMVAFDPFQRAGGLRSRPDYRELPVGGALAPARRHDVVGIEASFRSINSLEIDRLQGSFVRPSFIVATDAVGDGEANGYIPPLRGPRKAAGGPGISLVVS